MTTYNTGNPIGSTDARDLYDNAQNLDNFANGAAASYSDRLGVSRRSLAGIDAAADNVLNSIGYAVPVAYASGISLTLTSQTVDYNGSLYAPKSSALPFTTSSWGADAAKFRAVQVTDADLITYTPAGTGAVATTVQSKLRESVSVLDFGAVGNGTADDTSEVQAALNSGALRVIIPPGMTVGVTGLIMVANQTLEIQGKIKKLSGTAAVISVASGCSVIGGEIDGNSVNCQGIVGSNTQNVTVRGVYIHNLGKVGIGSYAVGSTSWVIQGNRIENTTEEGIVVEYTNDCLIENNRVNTALHGIRWWGGDSQVSNTLGIYGLRVHGNIVYGAMGGIWGSLGGNITVTGNHVENCSDVGIDFEGCADFTCTGNTAYECANGCYAVFFGSQRGSFSGNTARNVTSNGSGFYSDPTGAYSAGYIEITCNSFVAKTRCVYAGPNASKSFSNSIITNNIFVSTGGFPAVEIAENTNLLISNNHITTVGSAVGILLDGVSNSMVRDNTMFGFSDTNSNPANGGGITLARRSASHPSLSNVVRGNRLDSYVYSIVDSCAADVTQSKNDIEHNHVLNVYRSTGGTYNGVIANNLNILTPATAVTATTF